MTTSTLLTALEAWLPQAQQALASARFGATASEIGRIESVADGIARVSGLPGARLNELLRFETGDFGFVLSLDEHQLGCVLLDESARLSAGMHVHGTGEVLRVPVGPGLLGRIVDPLGRPLDGGAPIEPAGFEPVEKAAPAIVERDLVVDPVQTGVLVVDAMFALGRGQRELIIGDRATGKTAIAVDAIINQRDSDIVCVYVAIGQKSSAVERVVQAVRTHGAPERTIFVAAAASSPPGLQWIAPFSGFTIAEYFRDRGGHVLVVVDDLSKHAATHRELALLTHQPPGREAYPGDVFYIHARLLERAARLSAARGGGSLTALPIAETEAGNLSAYIPTNLISITDGQIVLDTQLFHAGHMPAVDTGLSVSRVGGKTQAKPLRKVVETLRLDYAQFLELEMFTRFGATLEPRVQAKIARGERTRAVLMQAQFAPLSLAAQVALLLALQRGTLDALPPARIAEFKAALGAWLAGAGKPLADAVAARRLPDDALWDSSANSLADLATQLGASRTAP
jgi:F-type H+-transporting ATPase subunit alpha